MNRVDNSLNFITLTMVLALSMAAGAAIAKDRSATNWLWPHNSIAVSQSTRALLAGHEVRAIDRATHALEKVQGYDRVVALHNVCMGYLRQGDAANANPACDIALTAAVAYSDENPQFPSVRDTVQANIQRERENQAKQNTNIAQASSR